MEKNSSEIQLPKRPKGNYEKNFKNMEITSNHFRVRIKNLNSVYLYKVDFQPKLQENDRLKRNAIFNQCNQTIRQHIDTPVCSGSIIYTTKKPVWGDKKEISLTFEDKTIGMHMRLVKTIKFGEQNANNDKMQLSFLNNLLRTSMRKLNFIEIGNTRKFFDASSKKTIPDLDMVIYQGYTANFCKLETGLFLKVDAVSKIVRRQTVLQFIDDIYQKNTDKDKDQRRNIVAESLKGQTVMANYGRSMYWKIENVIFGQQAQKFSLGGRQLTLSEYYLEKYSLKMQTKNQPLLQAKTKNQTVMLVPEFCLMTGLPQNIDERKRRQISLFTSKTVDQKVGRIQKFRRKLDLDVPDISPEQLKDKLGISIDQNLAKLDVKKIDAPTLQLKGSNTIENGRQANFKLFDKPLYNTSKQINMAVLHFSNFDFTPIKKLFENTSKNLGLNTEIKAVDVGNFSNSQALDILSKELKYLNGKKIYNIFLVVLPNPVKSIYKHLKKLCYCELNVLLQVVNDGILKKKEFQSVATKVLLQMAAKVGNVLWFPKNNTIQNNKIMVIGINTSSQKSSKGKKRIGYCASINEQLTRFFSQSETQDVGCAIIEHMENLVFTSIKAYLETNRTLPSQLIILRDGCSQSQVKSVVQFEVSACLDAIKKFEQSIKLNFVVIDKKPTQKFFSKYDNRYQNPPAGTMINTDLVSQNYDFFLISQLSTKGTAIPTYYQVLYSDSKLQQGVIQQIVYNQCFNYCNWSGSIKIPSPIQYAKKLCEFLSTNLNENKPIKTLQNYFYYI